MSKRVVNGGLRALELQMKAVVDDERYQVLRKDETDGFVWTALLPSAVFLEDADQLFHDLERYAAMSNLEPTIELELRFPTQYPTLPPFVRVVRPRFQFHTGHVTIGGSICTEMLTTQGWSSTMSVLDMLIFIQQDCIINGKGRVDFGSYHHPYPLAEYSFAEAQEAFNRVARDHGWA